MNRDDDDESFASMVRDFQLVLGGANMNGLPSDNVREVVGEKRSRRENDEGPLRKHRKEVSEWILVYSNARTMKQRYHYNVTADRLAVHVAKGLSDGLYISSVSSWENCWAVIMDAGTSFTDQLYSISSVFVDKEWVLEQWGKGFYITSVAGSVKEHSLVVMSKGTPYTQQSYKLSRNFPYKWVQCKWAEGFCITAIGTCNRMWMVVVSNNTEIKNQVVEFNCPYPNDRLSRLHHRGLEITAVGCTLDQAAFVLSSPKKSSSVQQVQSSLSFPSHQVKLLWSASYYVSSLFCGWTRRHNKGAKAYKLMPKLLPATTTDVNAVREEMRRVYIAYDDFEIWHFGSSSMALIHCDMPRISLQTIMLMACGWSKLLPIFDCRQPVVYVKVYREQLLVVSWSDIQVWSASQHKVRLGHYTKEHKALQDEGPNILTEWRSDAKIIAILTAACFLCFYEVVASDKKISYSGEDNNQISLLHLKRSLTVKLSTQTVTASASDDKVLLFGLSDGSIHLVSWHGESLGTVKLSEQHIKSGVVENGVLGKELSNGIAQLELSSLLRQLVIVFRDGRVLQCSISGSGIEQEDDITVERWVSVYDAVCVSIGHELQLLAVGSQRGTVDLFNLADTFSHLRTISLFDWGYSVEDTGAIKCMSWTLNNCALAVGWKNRGLSVWSVSGCRLMCTIRQGSSSTQGALVGTGSNDKLRNEPMGNGVSHLAWGSDAFSLFAAENRHTMCLFEFPFVKSPLARCISGNSHVLHLLYGEDRLLLVQAEEEDELKIQHLVFPFVQQSYISVNWPVRHVAINEDGTYLAAAGKQGVILYDVCKKKWRVFGDVMQERQIRCCGLLWLGKIIVVCCHRESTDSFELNLYPRYHLDESSLLFRKPLPAQPMAMDVWQQYILVAFAPFDIQVFHVDVDGKLTPNKAAPLVQMNIVRELSIVSVKKHPVAMQFVPAKIADSDDASPELTNYSPVRCLVLRRDGELSVLDLDRGSELSLVSEIERFWVTCGHPKVKGLSDEVSWWAYGHQGMQVWYPSSTWSDSTSQFDPEIGFDREVYPLALCPSAGILVGVSQRLSVSACSDMPCFDPTPQAHTILPCLLHQLLQRCKKEEALQLAKLFSSNTHFSHSLEWLLFTVFDAAISSQSANELLQQVCELIRHFPEFLDVVVSVARKTDGRHWPVLFSAAGESTRLFEECFQRKSYHTATCYILVIAKMEGPSASQRGALRLLEATLDECMYELAGELVQFLLRIGREYEGENKKMTSVWLKLPSSVSNSKRAVTEREGERERERERDVLSPTVRNLLENHAIHLMSTMELSHLVAFVKETQFNLTRFLEKERNNSARLEDLASALRRLTEKLPMEALHSRLDAEFLLAHMCTVGFREWIVVLATLLRRAELLVELFRGDMRLWQAYKKTLNCHGEFSGYKGLVTDVEDVLLSSSHIC